MLGNGDVVTAADALSMVAATGCDGVVVGRGCLGRPWLFAELDAAFAGRPLPEPPNLGQVADVIRRHVALLVQWHGGEERLPAFRKHLAWYLKGYAVGSEVRRRAGQVGSVADVEALLGLLDPDVPAPEGAEGFNRSHSNPLSRVALPEGWLDDPEERVVLAPGADAMVSGG